MNSNVRWFGETDEELRTRVKPAGVLEDTEFVKIALEAQAKRNSLWRRFVDRLGLSK